ncbi:MAG TPA: methyl-accepting chemotaxis protein, partial [Bacillota bacterium]|nr:methyl-accepting chemotaxis protein [Bacillota bacterium]
IVDAVSIPFKNLKVFYQILIIAGFMLIFLGVEGWLGISTMNTMNVFSREVFNNGFQEIYKIRRFQTNFEKLRTNYLRELLGFGNLTVSGYEIAKPVMEQQLAELKKINPESADAIESDMTIIERMLGKPISTDNYKELESSLLNVNYMCDNALSQVSDISLRAMNQGEQFSNLAKLVTLILLIVGIGLALLVSFTIAIKIARPLKTISLTANALAEGDLTKTISVNGSVEVAVVIESLNKAIYGLRKLVGSIDEQSNMLYQASRELKNTSDANGQSATEIAKTMEELAIVSTEQANQESQAVENVNSLGDLVREVSNEMKNISSDSQSVAQSADIGQKVSNEVANEIVKLYNTTREVSTIIRELEKDSIKISEITTMIEGVAEQTTLLALNAAIEAARAGEQGKGFAIVAHETGKLAEQSKEAASNINQLIIQMKNRIDEAVNSISIGMKTVEIGKNRATEATVTFNQIFEKLIKILNRIDSIALSARTMAEKNENVIATITNIAALSQENTAVTEEVSATSQEQSASVLQVAALAVNLAEIATRLKQSVAEFKIGEAAY